MYLYVTFILSLTFMLLLIPRPYLELRARKTKYYYILHRKQ